MKWRFDNAEFRLLPERSPFRLTFHSPVGGNQSPNAAQRSTGRMLVFSKTSFGMCRSLRAMTSYRSDLSVRLSITATRPSLYSDRPAGQSGTGARIKSDRSDGLACWLKYHFPAQPGPFKPTIRKCQSDPATRATQHQQALAAKGAAGSLAPRG